ncbi:MAG: uncharacterized protein QOE70_3638 [Chthoniobacter sp.]|jgi:uncharacterized protein (TIGR01777 family)|nr:uncharacterized protein [Chthoniobacter sp.]
MRVVITGGTGFLGRPLVEHLVGLGYECTVLTRDVSRASQLGLPVTVKLAPNDALPPADAVIHLAGESIVGRWSAQKKEAILASRVEGTRRLVAAIRTARVRPHTLLAASAVGFYGHRPGTALDENAPGDPARSFRAEVCRAWEEAANEADALGVRVVNLRIGNVLHPDGGFLAGLLPIYRGLGGIMLGEPSAVIPWISREDGVRLISYALAHERWYGPLNLVAPESITHGELAKRLSARLGRRFLGKAPARLVRLALGEFASALLDDQRVIPGKASRAGFRFEHRTWPDWLDTAYPLLQRAPDCELAPVR